MAIRPPRRFKPTQFSFSPELHRRLKKLAEHREISASALVRQLVIEYLERTEVTNNGRSEAG